MKCTKCATCTCSKCRPKTAPSAALADGTYPNATVVVRGGKVVAVRPGKAVFHSFSDQCTAPVSDNPGVEAAPSATPFLLESTSCVQVDGKGTSSSPAKVSLRLNPEHLICSSQGLSLRHAPGDGFDGEVAGFTVVDGLVTALPKTLVTGVVNDSPGVIKTEILDGVLHLSIPADAAGVGKTRYTTMVPGTCAGPYPVWVNYVGPGQFTVNIGGVTPTIAPVSFTDLASAIAAADSLPQVSDCP